MRKMIPVYLIQLAILGTVVMVGMMLLRKAEAIRSELAGIRSEQLKQPSGAGRRPWRSGVVPLPVEVMNEPLGVTVSP